MRAWIGTIASVVYLTTAVNKPYWGLLIESGANGAHSPAIAG